MGAYLSEPKTDKDSLDMENPRLRCGASSMQGWRISQEDAHNCLLDFDKNASLFAVYDGHGGHEVAEYCSKYLPDFIKKTETFVKGEFEQCLKEAFLGFDDTLTKPEVIEVMKAILSGKDGDKAGSNADSEEEEEDAIDNLVQEAHMPLDEVMAKYKLVGPLGKLKAEANKPPLSPKLRARRSCTPDREVASSRPGGSGEPSSSGALALNSTAASSSCGSGDDMPSSSGSTSTSGTIKKAKDDDEVCSSSSDRNPPELCNGDHINGEVEKMIDQVDSSNEAKEVKEESVEPVKKLEKDKSGNKEIKSTDPDSSIVNGDIHDVSASSSEVGEESNGISSSSSPPKKKLISQVEIYQKLLQAESDSEEEDETFRVDAESDDDSGDEDEEGKEGEEDDDDDDDDSSAEDEEEEDEDCDHYPGMDVKEEPGSDSGCTAVVALLTGDQLFVANAGDSRCVVCRDGLAVEMSVDHKPEDELEKERIESAGGKVTMDGRVNGGLNLSRAIGDHSYKQVKHLTPSRQMISALPDVKQLTIDLSKDEFMVLACDGIWNSMTSQEVVDFVKIKLEQKTEQLSKICEELFDHCLAPNTQGDGTGCDNMTCVIVQFKPITAADNTTETIAEPMVSETSDSSSSKRPAEEESEEPSVKKSKVEDETNVKVS